ncbi:tyrosine-type recombinase/integrase [Rhodococcus sp. I2R]|uniref:tyrosine-type recombinase/integrase n=1 Tax=Rhodococcus sp. I2R TaxID=2855445 RepID=UPI001E49CB70|nr:tyrosine-type recombinase/integrase [Rhodococcus sp. I2R]MCC8929743.1 tyrosine-type recombinase/integrase [Rhodococcus sp. I2R]
MPRPPLELGTWGKITRTELKDGGGKSTGVWVARTRYRDYDGVTRQVKANGRSGAKAEAALKVSLRDRQRSQGGNGLTGKSTVGELLALWITTPPPRGVRSPQTLSGYQRCIDKIIAPGLSKVRLHEATTGRIETFLRAVRTDSGKRDARGILSQAFALAARLDAVDYNPVADTSRAPTSSNPARALTIADVHELRRRVLAWQDRDLGDGTKRFGPERAHDLAEIIDVMIGTGTRIGECLALRWQDIDGLNGSGPVVVTVTGTLVELAGTGVFRQDHPKTASGRRTVTIPGFSADALRRQRDRGIPSSEGLVFPSRLGTPRWPGNVRTSWRQVRGEDYSWVKPHSFRKTVGTMVERELGLSAASAQLGHSGSAVTEKHYIQRANMAPDVSSVLDKLAPR